MKPKDSNGYQFSLDSPAQFEIIGYSQDYDICKGRNAQATFMNQTSLACKEFLNKSVENICDRHKMERKLMQLDKFKQGRQNCQGDRVDIN